MQKVLACNVKILEVSLAGSCFAGVLKKNNFSIETVCSNFLQKVTPILGI